MIYEDVEEQLENLFASRLKNVSEASKSIWAKEILAKHYSDKVIYETIKEMVNDDNLPLTLASFFRIAKAKMPTVTRKRVDCPYCNGTGIVLALKFDGEGKYVEGADYGLSCVCANARQQGLTVMNEDTETNHKTVVKDGYYLVFPSIVEKFSYIDKVYANDGYDICK